MTQLVIGPWTLTGTDAQNEILMPMYAKMAGILALPSGDSRVKPAQVRILPRDQMPWAIKPGTSIKYPQGVRAAGYWNGTNQLIAADQFAKGASHVRKLGAHETAHQLEDQWMLRSNERDIKPLFDPDPAAFPSEEFAVYGSAAIFGFTDPPYTTFYDDYVIPKAAWPKVKQFALRDDHVDPCLPYKVQIASLTEQLSNTQALLAAANTRIGDLETDLALANAANAELTAQLEACNERVAGKDQSMKEGLEK